MFKSKLHTETATELTYQDVSKALARAIAPQVVKMLLIMGIGYACRKSMQDRAAKDPEYKAMLERLEAHV